MRRLLSLCMAGSAAVLMVICVALFGGGAAQSAARYSEVVDNADAGFSAPGWKLSDYSPSRIGKNYNYTEPGRADKVASYRFDIPKTAGYSVFVSAPSNAGYSGRVKVGVLTTSGLEYRNVSQRRNGGKWIKLGYFKLEEGSSKLIRVSPTSKSEGYIIADGARVVRGDVNATSLSGGGNDGGGNGGNDGGSNGGGNDSAIDGADVLREAKDWLGVPYRYGGTSRSGVDCSGLTYSVYRELGITLNRTASDQYNGGPGQQVSRGDLRRGYLVFGNAGGSGIQHVGIATGDGRMIHAPQPGTVVRYDDLPNGWYSILGVKKVVPAS